MTVETSIEKAWWTAVDAVKGERAVADAATAVTFEAGLQVAAIGKAAPSMLKGLLRAGVDVERALVVTKDGHSDPELADLAFVRQFESAHPVPDERSLEAGRLLIEFVQSCSGAQSLLLLVSGGASSLAESLVDGETLSSLQEKTQRLLAEGADIATINRTRCTLSKVKGGGLASFAKVPVRSWILSDVAGDDPAVVGSGIGLLADHDSQCIVASNATAREAAVSSLGQDGLTVRANEENLYDDVFVIAERIAQQLQKGDPGV